MRHLPGSDFPGCLEFLIPHIRVDLNSRAELYSRLYGSFRKQVHEKHAVKRRGRRWRKSRTDEQHEHSDLTEKALRDVSSIGDNSNQSSKNSPENWMLRESFFMEQSVVIKVY
jgi:hypothetical protein